MTQHARGRHWQHGTAVTPGVWQAPTDHFAIPSQGCEGRAEGPPGHGFGGAWASEHRGDHQQNHC